MSARSLSFLMTATLVAFAGCAADDAKSPAPGEEGGELIDGLIPEGQDGKLTFDATGDVEAKADDLQGARGIKTSYDDSSTQVWKVTRDWDDTDAAAGMAWPADSNFTWQQKYRRWVDQMQKTEAVNGWSDTYTLITPYGKELPGPSFECAESALFLRALFASWYGLPFVIEARANGQRLYLGHMGFRFADSKYGNTPDFKRVYPDYSDQANSVADGGEWPSYEKLRKRKLAGGFDDEQPALNIPGAHAGTYLDELLLNKRVGFFMIYLLSYFGSVNVADSRNTYNRTAESILPGDIMVHRYGYTGIGHVLIVKEVTEQDGRFSVELMSGSMPRRQPSWEDPNSSRYSLEYSAAGSSEDSGDGVYAKFGGGLKGWRAPKAINGKWALVVPAEEQDTWVDSTDLAAIGARVEKFKEILTALGPEERRQVILDRIQDQRDHLSRYPASCAARRRRADTFRELYAFQAEHFQMSATQVDVNFRTLSDYVFAELNYEKSKTCCWNTSTEAMYEIVMLKAQQEVLDHTASVCAAPTVFKAMNGGYDHWKNFAVEIGRGDEWVDWSEDEACPPADVSDDSELDHDWAPFCEIGDQVMESGRIHGTE